MATSSLPLNTWTHIATTYDGTTLRLSVNGVQVGQLAYSGAITTSTGALKIGGNAVWGECFQGDIDEVRIYNRALTATEIQADMNTSISAPDTTAAERAGDADRDGRARPGRARLGRGDRQRRVARYNVHRGTSAGFTPSRRQPDRAADRHELHGRRPRVRHLLLPRHRRGRRRQRRPGRQRGAAASPPPTRRRRPLSITAPARVRPSPAASVTANASDNGDRRRRPVPARRCEPWAPRTRPLRTRSAGTPSRPATGRTRSPRSRATRAGNTTTSASVAVTVLNTGSPGSSAPGRSTRAAARRPPTSPDAATSARSRTRPG